MYKIHWGLREYPFQPRFDSAFVHQSVEYDETQARLQFLVEQKRRLGLVVGEHGSGKSLQLERFAERLKRSAHLAFRLQLTGMDADETLFAIAERFGLPCSPTMTPFALWRRITDRLSAYRYERRHVVLLLDDADMAQPDAHMQIRRLLQAEGVSGESLTVVLAAHPEKLHRVGRRLLELVDLRIDVAPWSLEDTEHHLENAMTRAGRDEPAFKREAIVRLHQLGHGVPRFINRLADLALVAGAGRELARIDRETVESVSHELDALDD